MWFIRYYHFLVGVPLSPAVNTPSIDDRWFHNSTRTEGHVFLYCFSAAPGIFFVGVHRSGRRITWITLLQRAQWPLSSLFQASVCMTYKIFQLHIAHWSALDKHGIFFNMSSVSYFINPDQTRKSHEYWKCLDQKIPSLYLLLNSTPGPC